MPWSIKNTQALDSYPEKKYFLPLSAQSKDSGPFSMTFHTGVFSWELMAEGDSCGAPCRVMEERHEVVGKLWGKFCIALSEELLLCPEPLHDHVQF